MRKFLIASLVLSLSASCAFAQAMGGGGTGGGGGGQAGGGQGGFAGGFGNAQGNSTGGAAGTPGSTQGFSGNLDAPTAFGQTTGQTGGGAGQTTGIPTAMNPFQTSYSNWQALGMSLVTVKATTGTTVAQVSAFGQPLYATTTSTTAGARQQGGLTGNTGNFGGAGGGGIGGAGARTAGTLGAGTLGAGGIGGGGLGGAGGLGGVANAGLSYGIPATFSTVGTSRAAAYVTSLGFVNPKAAPGRLQADVQQVMGRSSLLSSGNIQLAMEGGTLVLRGQVADDRERRLAEGMVRLTPGVRDLRNELVIRPQ